MTAWTPILEGDLTGTAFGGSPSWTAYTSYVLNDGAVDITWGRQDQRGAITPTTFSFLLDNSDGRFTVGGSIINTSAQFRFRVTVNGTTYDRCAGYVDSVEGTWRGGVQTFSVIRVNCVDLSARVAEAVPLRSMVEYEMLADSPTYLYPLSEPNPSRSAADIVSSSNPLAVRVDSKYGATKADFGASMTGLLDGETGVQFGDNAAAADSPLTVLSIAMNNTTGPFLPAVGAHSQECWVVMPESAPATAANILYQAAAPASPPPWAILSVMSTGLVRYGVRDSVSSVAPTTATSLADGKLHHFVVTLASDKRTVRLYVDGVLAASEVAGADFNLAGLKHNMIGGTVGINSVGGSTSFNQFPGVIAKVAMYPTELSAARVLAHYQAGVGTGPAERSDQRYSRLLGYVGLATSGLPTGQATMAGQRTVGKNLTAALQQVATTEGTDSFVKPNGNPTFQARNQRYWPTSAFTLSASNVDNSVTVRKDRQGLVNDQTVTRDGGAAQRVKNASSITSYGTRDGGSLEVASSTDYDALQNAAWRVTTGKDPQTRFSSVKIDILAQTDTSLVQSIMQATISTPFTVSSLPSQTPGGTTATLFVEGGQEKWSLKQASIEFYTSPLSGSGVSFTSGTSTPNTPNTLRADGSASERTKLDAGLKIPF